MPNYERALWADKSGSTKLNLNQNFWKDPDDDGRVQKPESTQLNYTPKQAESLLKNYSKSGYKGIHQKNVNLDGQEGTLSVSRTHNSLLKKGGEVPKITFYPRDEAWINQMNQDLAKAEFATNLPLHLAPFATLATGGTALAKTQYRQNPKFRANVNTLRGRGMQIKKDFQRSDILNPGQITINATPVSGKPIPSETSASVLGKNSMFRRGSKSEQLAINQRFENQAVQDALTGKAPQPGQPYAMAYENVKPSNTAIHDASLFADKKLIKKQLGKWLVNNEEGLRSGEVKLSDFGTIQSDGKDLRISSKWKDYLADSSRDIKNIQFRPTERNESRELQSDPGGIGVLNRNITRMNKAFTDSGGEIGLNPEHLNPQIFRKGITYSARKVREFNKVIRKELGLDIQQEHSLGLAQGGTDDAMGFFLGSGRQNLALNALEDPDAFTTESAAELGIPGKANVKAAAALKGQTPRHEERRQEYLQEGWLQSLSNWGIKAKEIGGNPFEAYNKILLQRKKDIASGKEIELRMPGSNVTMTDMIRIQQLGFKMDRVQAAQEVMADRALIDASIAAGVTDTPKGLKLLEKYIKHIDVKIEVERAAKEGKPFKQHAYEEVHPSHYKTTELPSQATGKYKPARKSMLIKMQKELNKRRLNINK